MTPVEFQYALNDFRELQEQDIKISYERMRVQTMHIHNISSVTKKKYKNVKQFMPFTWEKKQKQTTEEMKAILLALGKSMGAIDKRKGKNK
ncbi:MAG: hypothetical protein B6I31_05490 [Desulfobacteraceae bacterium 4572_19]|nr:MAG: hypothetical protein B6I31_05490 [Desulfobacteraceae bacterium 4572_19]